MSSIQSAPEDTRPCVGLNEREREITIIGFNCILKNKGNDRKLQIDSIFFDL